MGRNRQSKRVQAPQGAGSVTLRSDGRWMARHTVKDAATGRGRQVCLYGKTESEARSKLLSALAAQQEGRALEAKRGRAPTVATWSATYLAGLKVRPRVVTRYRQLAARVVAELGPIRLRDLTVRHVDTMLTTLKLSGMTSRTANHHRAILRQMLGEAMRDEYVSRNVAELAKPLALDDSAELPLLSGDEVRQLLSAAPEHRDGTLWITALATGMRASELVGLEWSAVDLDNCQVRVVRSLQRDKGEWIVGPPKSRRSRRTIPLATAACEALRAHRAQQAATRLALPRSKRWSDEYGQLVFREPDGQPLNAVNMTKRLQYSLEKMGLPVVRFHDFGRAGCATFLALSGIPVATAQAILGHSASSLTLDIYTRVNPGLAREAAAAMDRVINGG